MLQNLTSTGQLVFDSTDLTAEGTTNWAAWHSFERGQSSISPAFIKKSGMGNISDIEPEFGGYSVRGRESTSLDMSQFYWSASDEANDLAGPSDRRITGVYNEDDHSTDSGLGLSISDLPYLAGGQYYQVNLYTTSYYGYGKLYASVGSGPLITQMGNGAVGDEYTEYFSVAYNPDNSAEVLNFTYLLDQKHPDYSVNFVSIQAVTLQVIPEPSTFWFLGGGLMWMVVRRWRRRF
ncbi:PEP-CTERM sorting domain-containing protein [Kiritimatiellota bacterium B12222]|nr:PEP-CTERM sorting domain-containing protein [Kiritimatiellota bacterium B12222]